MMQYVTALAVIKAHQAKIQTGKVADQVGARLFHDVEFPAIFRRVGLQVLVIIG